MELQKIRDMLEVSKTAFGPLVGTDERAMRRYISGDKPTPWDVQSRADRLILDRYMFAHTLDGTEYIIRVHPPGLIAEAHKMGLGYSLTILAWLDPVPTNPDALKAVVEELKAYWKLRDANR